MKKAIPVILVILMTLSFSACSQDVKEAEKAERPQTTAESITNKNTNEADTDAVAGNTEEQADSTAGYDAYAEDLIKTGYINDVKDNGNGSWTLIVTDKWNKMDDSEKEEFANDIFGELCEKSGEEYGVLATVKMVDISGKKVAVSRKDGGGMKIYE